MKIRVENVRMVENPESARKAFCSVVIEEAIVLNDIAIVEGKNGLFASMPQRSYTKDGETKYTSIYNPITKEAREELLSAVLGAYEKALDEKTTA